MKQRDLWFLQGLADDVKGVNTSLNYINFRTDENTLYCEASNGICFSYITKVIHPYQEMSGLYEFTGNSSLTKVILQDIDTLINESGEVVGKKVDGVFPRLNLGKKGEYRATFDSKELFDTLKYLLSRFKNKDKLNYKVKFTRCRDKWQIIGYYRGVPEFKQELACFIGDTIIDDNFNFTLNAHTLRHIMKWHEITDVDFYFQNISGTVKQNIYILNPSQPERVTVIRPIYAREK